MLEAPKSQGHSDVEPTIIYTRAPTGPARASRAPWMACGGECQACGTEAVYHPNPNTADALKIPSPKAYADFSVGVLCRHCAAHRSCDETVYALLGIRI